MRKTQGWNGACRITAVLLSVAFLLGNLLAGVDWDKDVPKESIINASGRVGDGVAAGGRGTPHGVIHINGNGEFLAANGVVSGTGAQADPYIIENWDIKANGGAYCIWIESTTAYFIMDCIEECPERQA